MNKLLDVKSYTASEAREKLYSLIKSASTGLNTYEITLRGSEPVVLINRAELESWQETIDILLNKKEIECIRKAKRQRKTITHKKMLQIIK